MATTYKIIGTLHHGRSDWPKEKVDLTGTFAQLTNELYGYMPEVSAREYEEVTEAGYIYWNTETRGLDETDPEDIEAAKAQGLIYDESAQMFVEISRRKQTAEELHAYAVEALTPDASLHLDVQVID